MDKKSNIPQHQTQRKLAVYELYGRTYVFDSMVQNERFPVEVVLSSAEDHELTTWLASEIKSSVKLVTDSAANITIELYQDRLGLLQKDEAKQEEFVDIVNMLRVISKKNEKQNTNIKNSKFKYNSKTLSKPYPNDIVADPLHYEYGLGIITQTSGGKIMVMFSKMPWPIDYGSESKPRRLKRVASWIDSLEDKHRKILKYCGRTHFGVRKVEIITQKRTSFCWLCKSGINNIDSFTCNGCGWIVCSCGACGCNFSK